MTDPSIFRHIKEVFREIDKEVEGQELDEPDASEIIKHLTRDGGGISVPYTDTFQPQYIGAEDVRSIAEEHYEGAYGLDGSTTKELTFNNGLILSVGVAATSVTGCDKVGELGNKSTVSISSYFDQHDIDVEPSSDDKTRMYFNQFPRVDNLSSDLTTWVNSIARSHAEGKQFEWISSDVDGPLFVDGPLLPSDILIWEMYAADGNEESTPMNDWPSMIDEIMQSYVNGIENCVKRGNPVYGIQKSTSATRVIDALEIKEPSIKSDQISFADDGMLFNSALNDADGGDISFTPWYIEDKIDVGSRTGLVTPLEGCDSISLNMGDYEDYKRAFFFAKPPTEQTVYRVGVPVLVLRMEDKDKIRNIALSEMAKQFKEPLPVVVADEKVRIPRNLRSKFRSLITSESHVGKNEQRNYE
jgi:hypothetical protein